MKIEITVTATGPSIDVDDEFVNAKTEEQQKLVEDAISMLHGLVLDLESE